MGMGGIGRRYGNAGYRSLARRPELAAHMAARYGVTVEHLLFIVEQRKRHRLAFNDRRRRRKGRLKNGVYMGQVRYSEEGELLTLLRAEGITQEEFAEVAGVDRTTLQAWRGWPLYRWPMRMLELFVWARNMARFLRSKGFDPDQFRAKLPERVAPQKERNARIVLEGLTDEDRAKARAEHMRMMRGKRLSKNNPDYSPWNP